METATSPVAALDAALSRVGDRWSLLIVEALLDGARRFNELAGQVTAIAPNILAERLRRLEREGVVISQPYSRRPLRLDYRLSEDGLELAGVLRLLAAWGDRSSGPSASGRAGLQHEPCGTALEARWYCPTCERSVVDAEGSDLSYA
ncbi:MAG: helix-turn-helix transcriptional regulator [Chloroflexota bacterium]|nr:helix-turn-helix transcriptional regulator [Chloroflexota bacterium]